MKKILFTILISSLLPLQCAAFAASTGSSYVNNRANTKLQKFKARGYLSHSPRSIFLTDKTTDLNADAYNFSCGSVNVGNIDSTEWSVGNTLRDHTVIIDGDIINANNTCR
ncbi:MAG: hypothetical protein ACE5D4_10695 [Thermodesulfobacteriota bacterium]